MTTFTTLKERFTGAVESLFLASILGWSLVVAVAVASPPTTREPHGSVEIYALAPAGDVGT